VARYGGEEFAVLLPRVKFQGLTGIAETIRRNVENLRLPHPALGRNACVTISVGGAWCYPRRDPQTPLLIEMADRALYAAKEQGRNRCVLARKEDWPPTAQPLLEPLQPGLQTFVSLPHVAS
jgi:diguanylate cyclase (GGDEF)-like protein